MSVMLSCTSNINWFIENFNSSLEEISLNLKKAIKSKNLIKNAPYYLPYLTGERTPINDPHVRASFNNVDISTTRSSMIYSLIEGISFALNDNYQALSKTNIKLENLYVIGGGSNNETWIKILASILNKNLAITETSDSMAAYGAAKIAFLGYNNLDHQKELKSPKVKKIIKKDSDLASMLSDRFDKWKKFYTKT